MNDSAILIFIVLALAYTVFIRFRYKVAGESTVIADSLTSWEKVFIWLLCLVNPIWGGGIMYYGWKKVLPNKASEANKISLIAFLIEIVIGGIIFFLLAKGGQI
ncbi:MAG: hypothetical protein Q7K16_02500 [Candidatus Azambacteria bacterium]|nr:hypothetical protein [Candidatus Azambacteria bacterium]